MAVGAQGAGVSFAGDGKASIGEFTISANGQVQIDGGTVKAEKAVKIVAPSIEVLNAATSAAAIGSLSGSVTLLANAGNIDITGSVTGVSRDNSDSKGGVTLKASGNISLLTQNAQNLAILFASSDDLSMTAGGTITNNTRRLLSNNRTLIAAGGDFDNVVDVLGALAGGKPVIEHWGQRPWYWPWGKRWRHASISWNAGSLRVAGQLAYVVGSSVLISAANVTNSGEIDAQTGGLQIDTGILQNTGVATDAAFYWEKCLFTCKSGGSSSVIVSGGAINAAGSMQLDASSAILNSGGTFTSYGNMALDAPIIVADATFAAQPGEVLNLDQIQQGVDQLNRAQSQHVSAKLAPGPAPGTSDVIVDIPRTQSFRMAVGYEIDGSSANGPEAIPEQVRIDLAKDNLLGLNDVWTGSLASGPDSNSLTGALVLPSRWATLTLNTCYSEGLSPITDATALFTRKWTGGGDLAYVLSRDKTQQTVFDISSTINALP